MAATTKTDLAERVEQLERTVEVQALALEILVAAAAGSAQATNALMKGQVQCRP